MEGTPARGQKLDVLATLLIQLCDAPTLEEFQHRLIENLSQHLRQSKALVILRRTESQELDFENLKASEGAFLATASFILASHVERHPELTQKLQNGEMVGVTRLESNAASLPAAPGTRNLLLLPIIINAELAGIVGLELAADALQHADDEVELVRQVSHHASPILARLYELETLRRRQTDNESLRAILEMQTHFQSNIAHELRTPLATVRGYTRMILDGRAGEIPQAQRDYLNIVTENANRLITLVNWMSHVLQYGSQHLKVGAADLAEIWAECLRNHREVLKDKRLQIRQEVPPGRYTTTCDRAKLEYVFNSLLMNAARRTAPGGQITIEFSRGRHREITVRISDSGENLPPEQLNKIFDRYYGPPLSASTPAESGLPGVYDIIGLHGGRLFINSRTGEGSTFLFTLPAVRQDSEEKGDDQTLNPGRRRR